MSKNVCSVFISAPSPIKRSRFRWSEMDFCTRENAFENLITNLEDAQSSIVNTDPVRYHNGLFSQCSVCSMVPYGAICTKCDQIQTSKSIALATPPKASWPVTQRLGDWEGIQNLVNALRIWRLSGLPPLQRLEAQTG